MTSTPSPSPGAGKRSSQPDLIVELQRSTKRERIVLGGRCGEEPLRHTHQRLDLFTELGGRLIETAHSYADGHAEQAIGHWLRVQNQREQVTLIDKFCHPTASGEPRVTPTVLRHELEGSLRRLGTDHIDIAVLHRDDPAVPVDDLVACLLDQVNKGRTRAFGVANWTLPRLAWFLELARPAGHAALASYQYSLATPTRELWPDTLHADSALLDTVRQHDVSLLAWAAQARGWFASPAPSDDHPFDSADNRAARARCHTLGAQRRRPATTIALAWTLHQPAHILTSVGPQTTTEIHESMSAADLHLTAAELGYLDARPGG